MDWTDLIVTLSREALPPVLIALTPVVIGYLVQLARARGVEINAGQEAELIRRGIRAIHKVEEWDAARQQATGVKLTSQEKEQHAVIGVKDQSRPTNVLDKLFGITKVPSDAKAIEVVKTAIALEQMGAAAKRQNVAASPKA